MFIEQPPTLLKLLYPGAIWRMNPEERAVYLTFDDGPIPDITPWVINLLDQYHIKATFFLVGDNVRKHPQEFRMILNAGHRVGNHTFNHLRGFGYNVEEYMANTYKADTLIRSDLFRPPHGHMGIKQYYALRKEYKIIMWDVVTRDYSKHLNGAQVFEKLKRYVRNGSIITFHDSLKAEQNMKYALPRSIDWLLKEGYEFKLL